MNDENMISPEQLRRHADNLAPSGNYWVCGVLIAAAKKIEQLEARVKELDADKKAIDERVLQPQTKTVLDFLQRTGHAATPQEIAAGTGIGENSVRGQLNILLKRGLANPQHGKPKPWCVTVQKHSASVISRAVEVMQLATGDKPDAAAVQLGRAGGEARARNLTAERRSEIASIAAAKRWNSR